MERNCDRSPCESYSDKKVTPGWGYSYRVAAVAVDGREGGLSSPASAKVPKAPISAPVGLAGSYDLAAKSLFLWWEPVAGATGYWVYWQESKDVTNASKVKAATEESVTISASVPQFGEFYFRVLARGADGDSPLSVEKAVSARPSEKVVVTRVELDKSEVFLNALPQSGDPDPLFRTSAILNAKVVANVPNLPVTWMSSDLKLVSVGRGGIVQAVHGATEGKAVIVTNMGAIELELE